MSLLGYKEYFFIDNEIELSYILQIICNHDSTSIDLEGELVSIWL